MYETFHVRAAHFDNVQKMTGRKELGISKQYKTMAAAVQHGIPSLVQTRDGHNFCVILGPNGRCDHRMV